MQKPSRELWFEVRDAIYQALQDRYREFTDDQSDVEHAKRIVHEAMLFWWTAEDAPTEADKDRVELAMQGGAAMQKPFLTSEQAEAIKKEGRRLVCNLPLPDRHWRMAQIHYEKVVYRVICCYEQALEEHTAKPGTREFCVPRKCRLYLCNPDAGYFTPACVHEGFDGGRCPVEKETI